MFPSQNNHHNDIHKSKLTDEFNTTSHFNNSSQTIIPVHTNISSNQNYLTNASSSNNITIFSSYAYQKFSSNNNNTIPNFDSVLQSYTQFNYKLNLQYFEDEIMINIFKYVDYPLNLALTCRNWSIIAKTPYAKTEWFLEHYGKVNALFNSIRLGPTFIDTAVWQILIAKNVISSINNGDTLNRIAKLPRQVLNDLPPINQLNPFFNGSSFD